MTDTVQKFVLQQGTSGADVHELTQLLVDRGLLEEPSDTFDRGVLLAVKGFQRRHIDERGHPLNVDGAVGPFTWWALLHPDSTTQFEKLADPGEPPAGGTARGRAALQTALDELRLGEPARSAVIIKVRLLTST